MNIKGICKYLVSWVVRKQELDQKNWFFKKLLFSLGISLDENIANLVAVMLYVRNWFQLGCRLLFN